MDPTKAYTGVGEATFATADLTGGIYGLNRAGKTIDGWVQDPSSFNFNQVPEVALDALGGTALFAYGNKAIPIVKGMANYLGDELPMILRSGPYSKNAGIIPENIARNLNERNEGNLLRASERIPQRARRVAQFDDLISADRADLISSGLQRYDIQGLLDRGYTPEQLR